MPEVSYLAIIVAGVASFVLGGIWYSPKVFGKVWQREAGVTDEQIKNGNMAKILGLALLLCLLAAWMFAFFLGPRPKLADGLIYGFSAGFFWVTASFGINYLFERRSFRLFCINGGYHTLQFTLIGACLSLLST